MKCLQNRAKITDFTRPPIQYGGENTEVCLEFHLKFGIHGILQQNLTKHQILMQIPIVSSKRNNCQHTVVKWEFVYHKKSIGRPPNRK
jgi:hypothetical protein